MSEDRPDPDALLARVQREEARRVRGRLKVFFGASAGVGKTYAMLSAAHEKRDEGVDVVIGIVETHHRADTEALLAGLEMLPARQVEYKGATLREFDLDAALARKPALIIVDELAHTNAQGSRHPKRWNDVEELLDAGIDVFTAVNVQHLESLKDAVAGITQVRIWETVPDTVFDSADEVELVDLPPDELIARLREGKVYMAAQAERAIQNFFRKGNLIALREMALRRTAERVEEQMRDYREHQGITEVWQAGERLLVCIGPGEMAAPLVRAGRRLANALHAEWIVAYVETPGLQRLPPEERDRVMEELRTAEQLGARTVTLSAPQMSTAILDYAHEQNITRIVLGKPRRSGWRRWLFGSVVDTLVREAGDIGMHLIGAASTPDAVRNNPMLARSRAYLGLQQHSADKKRWMGYVAGAVATAAASFVGWISGPTHELVNVVMIYLLGVMLVAMRFGRGPSIFTAALSVAVFDFAFIPPAFTFAVSDTRYVVTFAVMFLVGIVISNLTASLRTQARIAGYREKRAAALYEFSRVLAASHAESEVVEAAVKHIGDEFQGQCVLLFADAQGRVEYPKAPSQTGSLHGADLAVAQWVHDNGHPAGQGTDTLAGAEAVYLPLKGAEQTLAVLAILPINLRRLFLPEQQRLLETFLSQTGIGLERIRLSVSAQQAQIKVETESLRNSLLAGISHDLRTPLAAIIGAASTLDGDDARLDVDSRRELARNIHDEAQRMARLANNILDMARLDSGAVTLNREWYPLEEIVGGVLSRLQPRLEGRPVSISLPRDLPLLHLDAVLIEQLFVNLIENALKYTPTDSAIAVSASRDATEVTVTLADRGPGIPPGSEEALFDKFYRAKPEQTQSGVGLGLTICRAIVTAHGGRIWAENRAEGGAQFHFTLPIEPEPDMPPVDEMPPAGAEAP